MNRLLKMALPIITIGLALPQELSAQQDRLAQRVDAVFAEYNTDSAPGCAVGVSEKGRLVYQKGFGLANLDHGVPLSTSSVFYVASVSKQFTAAITLFLADDGLISLDDDIRKYIPELPDYGTTITIRQLVHHTSGIRDYLRLMNLAGMRVADIHSEKEILDLIANQKETNFQPGTKFLYNNSGYFLISVLTRRVSGKSLRQYADEKIFQPLGMKNTHFHDDRRMVVPGRATSYTTLRSGEVVIADWTNFEQVGSGGLHSTVEDLFLWDQNFYDNKLSARDLIPQMHELGVLASGDTTDYAFGTRIGSYRGLRTVRHGGTSMGFRAHHLRFPDQNFAAIILCNTGKAKPGPLAEKIADIYLADQLGARERSASTGAKKAGSPPKLSRDQLREFAGTYHSPELGVDYTVVLGKSVLLLDRPAANRLRMTPTAKDAFRSGTLNLEFTRDESGKVNGFLVDAGRAYGIRFVRN